AGSRTGARSAAPRRWSSPRRREAGGIDAWRTRRGSPVSTRARRSPPTTPPVVASARMSASRRGRSPSATSPAQPGADAEAPLAVPPPARRASPGARLKSPTDTVDVTSQRLSAPGTNLQPARNRVQRDREQEDHAGDDVDDACLVAGRVQAVRHGDDHERA